MNFLKKFRENKKGITALVIGMVVVLVACAVLVPIGLLVTSNLQASMPALEGSANSTAYSVYNNVYSAFSLSAIVPIVAAAILPLLNGKTVRGYNQHYCWSFRIPQTISS